MQGIDPISLGATLFVPATHKALEAIATHKKYPQLKSLLIDTEDGLQGSALQDGLRKIAILLSNLRKSSLYIFIRPKNPTILAELLEMQGIENITGFILPKFSLCNADVYLELLRKREFFFMPSIEGEELFHHQKLCELKNMLLEHKEQIPLVRFGLEDMLRSLGLRRSCEMSVFDLSAPSTVLGNFIATFKSSGFMVSGGVYPCFKDADGFVKDVKRDLQEGLFSKTIIHPNQIALAHECYKVTKEELEEAELIIASTQASFALSGKMAEPTTMREHSYVIVKRAQIYGLRKSSKYEQ